VVTAMLIGKQTMPKKQDEPTRTTGFRVKGLKELTEKKGLTRQELHYATRIRYQTLMDLEDDKKLRAYVTADIIDALMRVLDCSYHDLIEFVRDGVVQRC